jgi:preprotein translocase subunit SecD
MNFAPRNWVATSTLFFVSLGCQSHPPVAESASVSAAKAVLEFAIVADDNVPAPAGSRTVEYNGHSYTLEPARRFSIRRADVASDPNGFAGIAFEIAESEQAEFKRWTGEHVHHGLAAIIDGQVVMIATITSALPGSGMIFSGTESWSDEHARTLAARIAPPN